MNRDDMIETLEQYKTKVTFKKINGEIRDMICTLNENYLPKTETSNVENPEIVTVWDLEKSAWRRFRVDSVINFEIEGAIV